MRVGRGFELSPLAERLKPAVEEAVEAAEALLGNQREFDPTSSNRLFTVSMSAYAMTVLAEPLTRLLAEQAPGCSVALESLDVAPDQFESQLLRQDLILAPLGFEFPGRRQPVFTDHLVCVVDRDNARLSTARCRSTTCKRCRRPSPRSGRPASASARSRSRWSGGHHRSSGARPGHSLLTLPFAVSGTEMCAFVPARLAHRCLAILDLVIADTPLEPVHITEAAHWHPRRTPSRPSSGCGGCCTTWPSPSRTPPSTEPARSGRPRAPNASPGRKPDARKPKADERSSPGPVRRPTPRRQADERRDDRAEAELGEAEHGAPGAGDRTHLGHRQGCGVAHDRAVGGDSDEDRDRQQPRRRVRDARPRNASVPRSWTATAVRTIVRGGQRSTRWLATQPRPIRPGGVHAEGDA